MRVAAWAGFRLGLGLIVAIGAQNALVLRQGLRREHVFWVALFCAVSDAVLIALGVSGFGLMAERLPGLAEAMRWAGAAFLLLYALRAGLRAWRGGGALMPGAGPQAPLGRVLLTVAAMTWANPHVWLDTVVLLGAVSAQYPGQGSGFAAGAMAASFLFFFALAYGARGLAPLFARPGAWRALDAGVAVLTGSLGLRLIFGTV